MASDFDTGANIIKFVGNISGLEDCIFDVGIGNQAELFNMNLKKLGDHAERTLRESQDIRGAIESVADAIISVIRLIRDRKSLITLIM